MTKDECEAIVAHWLESELEYAEDCRAMAGSVSEAHRDSQLEGLSIMQDETKAALLSNDYRKIERDADQHTGITRLIAAGVPEDIRKVLVVMRTPMSMARRMGTANCCRCVC
jgi:hypothetical protein